MLLAAAFLAFVVCIVLVRVLLLARLSQVALDRPNARSLHDRPIPRTGGIAILAAIAVPLVMGAAALWLPMTMALALAALSFFDDRSGVPRSMRLAAHLAAAGLLVWYVLSPMDPVDQLVLVLALAWITNLYNFMDGADGLAAGMAVIGFGAYGVAAWLANDLAMAMFCTAIAAAAVAFLIHNFYPARIFLGDVGSIPLGFLAGALGVLGWRNDLWPLWFPVLVFAPFIADATVTLVRRLVKGERVWRAHREHYYQRMVRMGLGHRGTALIGYAIMAACAAIALLGRMQPPALQAAAFGAGSAMLLGLAVWVDIRWRRFLHAAEGTA